MTSLSRGGFARSLTAAPLAAAALASRCVLPGGLRILMFHDVPPEKFPDVDALIERLVRAQRVLTPQAAESLLAGGSADRRSTILVSFDDGFASNLDVARMILDRHGVKAVFFVCPALIDLSNEAQRAAIARHIFDGRVMSDGVRPSQRLLTWDEVQWLALNGHTIGSHTLHHQRLAGAPKALVEEEVGGADRALRERLGTAVHWFAYPFGDIASIDGSALTIIGQHHKFCRSGVRGWNHRGTSPLGLLAEHIDLDRPRYWQNLSAEGVLDFRYAAHRRRLAAYACAAEMRDRAAG